MFMDFSFISGGVNPYTILYSYTNDIPTNTNTHTILHYTREPSVRDPFGVAVQVTELTGLFVTFTQPVF